MKSILNLRYLLALAVVMTIFSSCGDDDPIRGCTDSESDNFNANAEESDGSCVFSRDKFIGVYLGSLIFKTYDQLDQVDVEFRITPGLATKNAVLVQLNIQNIDFTLDGEATENGILVDYENQFPDGSVINPALAGSPVDVTFKGTVTSDDDGASIMGVLDLVADGMAQGFPVPVTIEDEGTLTGVKQQ